MNICPYSVDNCGPSKNITFGTWDMQANISVSLSPGETCNYFVTTECGVPAYTPGNIKGFEIYSIDYMEDNLNSNNRRRMLQSEESAAETHQVKDTA
jgi:hypothetical protein